MRLDAMSPRTWLLGTFTALAVTAYGLTLLGLGGRIASSGKEDTMSPPGAVAHLQAAPPERLGQIDQYAAIAARSLFSSDRSPREFRLVSEDQSAHAVDVRLTGVLIATGIRMATLQTSGGDSLRLREGADAVDGWRLVSLEARSAKVEGPDGTRNLELQVEGGPQEVGMAGTPSVSSTSTTASRPTTDPEAAGGPAINATSAARPSASEPAPATADTSQERIEAIRQQIEARRRQLQQGQGGAPVSNP